MNKSKAILAPEHLVRNPVYNMLKMLHLCASAIHASITTG